MSALSNPQLSGYFTHTPRSERYSFVPDFASRLRHMTQVVSSVELVKSATLRVDGNHMWWSVVLTGCGVSALYLGGSGRRIGWWLGLVSQGLWITYTCLTQQWGFIGAASVYAVVYARNLIPRRGSSGQSRKGDLKRSVIGQLFKKHS